MKKKYYLCSKKRNQNNKMLIKLRDHHHYIGNDRRTAHLDCNLQYRENNYMPIIVYNSSGYDTIII